LEKGKGFNAPVRPRGLLLISSCGKGEKLGRKEGEAASFPRYKGAWREGDGVHFGKGGFHEKKEGKPVQFERSKKKKKGGF